MLSCTCRPHATRRCSHDSLPVRQLLLRQPAKIWRTCHHQVRCIQAPQLTSVLQHSGETGISAFHLELESSTAQHSSFPWVAPHGRHLNPVHQVCSRSCLLPRGQQDAAEDTPAARRPGSGFLWWQHGLPVCLPGPSPNTPLWRQLQASIQQRSISSARQKPSGGPTVLS